MEKNNKKTTVAYLNHSFSEALKTSGIVNLKNTKGTDLYDYQVEYCYLINEVQRGPDYNVQKTIEKINSMIEELCKSVNQNR